MFKQIWINIHEAIAELLGIDYYSDEEPLDEEEDYEDVP